MLPEPTYAVAHVSPNCDQRTVDALQELVNAAASLHGRGTPIPLILVERDSTFPAAYLRDTEAFDA